MVKSWPGQGQKYNISYSTALSQFHFVANDGHFSSLVIVATRCSFKLFIFTKEILNIVLPYFHLFPVSCLSCY